MQKLNSFFEDIKSGKVTSTPDTPILSGSQLLDTMLGEPGIPLEKATMIYGIPSILSNRAIVKKLPLIPSAKDKGNT